MAQQSATKQDPLPAFRFYVTLVDSASTRAQEEPAPSNFTNSAAGAFSECTGLESTMDVYDYKAGGVNDRIFKFPTRAEFSNITLKRGIGITNELWLWYYDYVQGRGKRRDGFIVLMNQKGECEKAWHFKRSIPVKWTGPGLNATQNALAIEALELAHEGFELMPPDSV